MLTLAIPDAHVSPDQDLSRFSLLGNLIVRRRPDNIVFLGDFGTFESMSAWDRDVPMRMEGKRFRRDVDACNAALDLALAPLAKLNERQRRMKMKLYLPNLVWVDGNHECVSEDTEVLTDLGWVKAKDLPLDCAAASFDSTGVISYAVPIAVTKGRTALMSKVEGDLSDEYVSSTHKCFVSGNLTPVENLVGSSISQTSFSYAGELPGPYVELPPFYAKVLTWVICDATIVRRQNSNIRIQFKLSKERKINALESLLQEAGISYTKRKATKSHTNKLQHYYICIYSDAARKIDNLLNGVRIFPPYFKRLGKAVLGEVLSTLCETDGTRVHNHIGWNTTSMADAETIQLACIHAGVPCKISPPRENRGLGKKPIYHVDIFDRGPYDRRKVKVTPLGLYDRVVSIATRNGTLITRRNGKVSFTGNSRIERYVEVHPTLDGVLSLYDGLNLKNRGFKTIVPYKKSVDLGGVLFTHIPMNAAGKAPGGKYAMQRVAEMSSKSTVIGHLHRAEGVNVYRHGHDDIIHVRCCGGFFEHTDAYAAGAQNHYWRGVELLHHWKDGRFDVEQFSIERLRRDFR